MSRVLPNGLSYQVEVGFPQSATLGDVFILNDPTKGELDDLTYVLGGDQFTDITEHVEFISITRGRQGELDAFNAATAQVDLIDLGRLYDPNNADSPYFRGVKPRRRVRITCNAQPLFSGWVTDWKFNTVLGQPFKVQFTCTDAFQVLANTELAGYTPTTTELAHVRIAAVLDNARVGWPAGERVLGTGVTTLNDTAVTGDALTYLNAVTQAEQGYLFIDRSGRVKFIGRAEVGTGAIQCTFADDLNPAHVPYRTFEIDYSSSLLFNRVVAERDGGTAQIVDDTPSQTEFLISTLSYTGLLLTTDAQALTLANLLLDRYADPRTRVQALETIVGNDGLQWQDAFSLDLGDKVRIIKRFDPGAYWPAYEPFDASLILLDDDDDALTTDGDVDLLTDFGDLLDDEAIVQNIQHQISASSHVIKVGLSPVYS
jgi:hypothetical protein